MKNLDNPNPKIKESNENLIEEETSLEMAEAEKKILEEILEEKNVSKETLAIFNDYQKESLHYKEPDNNKSIQL